MMSDADKLKIIGPGLRPEKPDPTTIEKAKEILESVLEETGGIMNNIDELIELTSRLGNATKGIDQVLSPRDREGLRSAAKALTELTKLVDDEDIQLYVRFLNEIATNAANADAYESWESIEQSASNAADLIERLARDINGLKLKENILSTTVKTQQAEIERLKEIYHNQRKSQYELCDKVDQLQAAIVRYMRWEGHTEQGESKDGLVECFLDEWGEVDVRTMKANKPENEG